MLTVIIMIISFLITIDCLLLVFLLLRDTQMRNRQLEQSKNLTQRLNDYDTEHNTHLKYLSEHENYFQTPTFSSFFTEARAISRQLSLLQQQLEREIQTVCLPPVHKDRISDLWRLQLNLFRFARNFFKFRSIGRRQLVQIDSLNKQFLAKVAQLQNGNETVRRNVEQLQRDLIAIRTNLHSESKQGIKTLDWEQARDSLEKRLSEVNVLMQRLSPLEIIRDIDPTYHAINQDRQQLAAKIQDWQQNRSKLDEKLSLLKGHHQGEVKSLTKKSLFERQVMQRIEEIIVVAQTHRKCRDLPKYVVAITEGQSLIDLDKQLIKTKQLVLKEHDFIDENFSRRRKRLVDRFNQIKDRRVEKLDLSTIKFIRQQFEDIFSDIKQLDGDVKEKNDEIKKIASDLHTQIEAIHQKVVKISSLSDENSIREASRLLQGYKTSQGRLPDLIKWVAQAQELQRQLQYIHEDLQRSWQGVDAELHELTDMAQQIASNQVWGFIPNRFNEMRQRQQTAIQRLGRQRTVQDFKNTVHDIKNENTETRKQFRTYEAQIEHQNTRYELLQKDIKTYMEQEWRPEVRYSVKQELKQLYSRLEDLKSEQDINRLNQKREALDRDLRELVDKSRQK